MITPRAPLPAAGTFTLTSVPLIVKVVVYGIVAQRHDDLLTLLVQCYEHTTQTGSEANLAGGHFLNCRVQKFVRPTMHERLLVVKEFRIRW